MNIKALIMQLIAIISMALNAKRDEDTQLEQLKQQNTELQRKLNEALANEGNLTADERDQINQVVAMATAALPPQNGHVDEALDQVSADHESVGPEPAAPLAAATGQSPAAAGLDTPTATDGAGISDPVTTGGADPTNVKDGKVPDTLNQSLTESSPATPAPGDEANVKASGKGESAGE